MYAFVKWLDFYRYAVSPIIEAIIDVSSIYAVDPIGHQ